MRSASSSNATGAMVRQLALDKMGNLAQRFGSALLLGPLVLTAIYFGPPYFDILMTVIAGIMAWEWARLCGDRQLNKLGYLVIVTVIAAMTTAVLREYTIAGWVVAAGAMAVMVLGSRTQDRHPLWYALGIVYAALPCLGLVWLREYHEQGRGILFWLVCVVWATDTGAYAAGRAIGGPKLAPAISPNKTWAGLAGGVLSAAAIGAIAGHLLDGFGPLKLALASAILAVVSQAGDLFESGVKRYFGAKDSSNLIPGHGGMLDRMDGVLAVGLTVAALISMRGVSL